MIVMLANHSSPRFHYLAGRFPSRLGWLIGPSAASKTKLRPWVPYSLDNDAFSSWSKGTPWDFEAWLRLLQWASNSPEQPRWCLVPDVVADREATLRSWVTWFPSASIYHWPLAFAVQDGMTSRDVPRNTDIVFVGGTTEWKWSTVATWAKNFPRVHVGRVNTLSKLLLCEDLGVESVDGTGWFRDPSDARKFDLLESYLSGQVMSLKQQREII